MTAADQYLLLWKGRQTGPFSIMEIREKLSAGEINRMNQINADGRWQILDEYLEKLRGADIEARRAEEQQMREADVRRRIEAEFNEERASLPRSAPPLAAPPGAASADPFGAGAPFPPPQSRMSGFAIAALVMGVCNLIPFVDFVSWILALVFGHIALFQMKADESLKGRGMAIAGLAITYFLLVVAATILVLCLVNNKPLPHF